MIHVLFHNLDLVAAALTLTGICLLRKVRRAGWLVSATGSVLWEIVALTSVFAGRPVWGQAILSAVTLCLNVWVFFEWRAKGIGNP